MTLEQLLPGSGHSLRAIAVIAVALLVAVGGAGYCAGAASVDRSQLEAAVKKSKDSIRVLEQARSRAIGDAAAAKNQVAEAHAVTAAEHERSAAVVARAESLVTDAERHRTFRIRLLDSTHAVVPALDGHGAIDTVAIPVEIVRQLAKDSTALEAQDLAVAQLQREQGASARELDALRLENKKLIAVVVADSGVIREQRAAIDTLTQLKSPPRCARTCGMVIGAAATAGGAYVLSHVGDWVAALFRRKR